MPLTDAEIELWLGGLTPWDRDNTVVLLAILAAFGIPKSYLDVGCGTGAMVNAADKLGIEARGIDQLPTRENLKLVQHDLRQPIDLGRTFELVTSIEVAEHLEEEFADTCVDNITRHGEHRIVFTAAMPGQKGKDHFNCQPAIYWRNKFGLKGWAFSSADTYRVALMLATAQHGLHHIEANCQVFLK